jgi:hypothetical protein
MPSRALNSQEACDSETKAQLSLMLMAELTGVYYT